MRLANPHWLLHATGGINPGGGENLPLGSAMPRRHALWPDRSQGIRIASTVPEADMTTATMTEKDIRVRDAVQRQLEWDPEVDASAIGVTAKDGSVVLTGYIDSYAGKLAAERVAKRVRGVRAVANDVEVRLKLGRTDADIASDTAHALNLHASIPSGVQAAVHDGHVTLTGTVAWPFQKKYAEKLIRDIRGVRGVFNHLALAPRAVERDVHHRINAALHRDANLDARQIAVTVDGNTATVTGTVRTWLQRESVERAVSDGPGITTVVNHLTVEPVESDDAYEIC
jgi:osmotically-inducible protein OsmY